MDNVVVHSHGASVVACVSFRLAWYMMTIGCSPPIFPKGGSRV